MCEPSGDVNASPRRPCALARDPALARDYRSIALVVRGGVRLTPARRNPFSRMLLQDELPNLVAVPVGGTKARWTRRYRPTTCAFWGVDCAHVTMRSSMGGRVAESRRWIHSALLTYREGVSVSASRSLMNACRLTPIRLASRSIASSKSTGKSTFTRWTSRPGRVAFARSRCAVRSSPASCILSRRAALNALVGEVPRFFAWARAADRDDADVFIAVSDESRPRVLANMADYLIPRFVQAASRNLQAIDIGPDFLRFDKVDPVLGLVRGRLARIELERASGIEIIPPLAGDAWASTRICLG